MSTEREKLFRAVQKIAMKAPEMTEVRQLLAIIRNRGGIDGLYMQIGGASDEEYKDGCCSNGLNGTESPFEKECQSIEGDAPTDMGGGLCAEEEWTDCATGAAINFSPAGFTQIETCKNEYADETWEQGYYFSASLVYAASVPAATLHETIELTAADAYPHTVGSNTFYYNGYTVTNGIPEGEGSIGIIVHQLVNGTPVDQARTVTKYSCVLHGNESEPYCQITEAPTTIGDAWEADDLTEYTVMNGCITASSCDTDASAAAKACNECITICNNSGEERTMCATADGGYILYDPTGINSGGKYDENGIRTELLPAGSTGGYINGA
ncbi:hypothetical protein [Marinobacterium lutimaris]|uniref:Uncharacterized protein n=1 Tax=Marinobacterium lutimaris TaxID=568106 RepID=A0A1H5XSN8_9GAMM|nr:hypothetical protein [Marinobacterium lutimaris]SEG14400.1 hypothetical protein SAMN05444390_1011481 [Marinobacterium lutimaris]